MFKTLSHTILLVLVAAGTASAAAVPDGGFAPGWTRTGSTLRFGEGDLFQYIDGGAELFIEFGFEELQLQRYRKEDSEIVLELYRMEGPESALGIYLTKCGDETPVPGVAARNSGSPYQFTVVKGDCFIQVNSFEGNENLVPVMVALIRETLATIPKGRPVRLLERLPRKNLVPGSQLIVRGPYALQPIFTFGEGDVLGLRGKVFGVVGDYVEAKGGDFGKHTRIMIFYPDKKAALEAFKHLVANLDPYSELLKKGDRVFVFKDYQGKFGTVRLENSVMDIRVNLEEEPE